MDADSNELYEIQMNHMNQMNSNELYGTFMIIYIYIYIYIDWINVPCRK